MSGNNSSGWNRPRISESEVRSAKKAPSAVKGLLAGLLVVCALGALCVWLFSGGEARQDAATPKERGRIKNVKPVTRTDLAKMIEAKTGKKFEAPPPKDPNDLGWYTNKLGEVKRRTSKEGFVIRARKTNSVFNDPAESQLDVAVNTPIGTEFILDDVPENFEETFAYSLTNRIEISNDDPPEIAERKRRVIEAKEALVELKNQGRDLREVMVEQRKMLKQKGEDYLFFEKGLEELRRNEATPEEIADYAMAAKKMMEEREIEKPLYLHAEETEAMQKLDNLINPKPNDAPAEEAPAKEKPNEE